MQCGRIGRGLVIIAAVTAVNIAIWVLAVVLIQPFWPLFLSQCLVAYTFGLRHAIDADHIAAIDNVTRRLVEAWKAVEPNEADQEYNISGNVAQSHPPLLTGFFFSLGHSSVVLIAVSVILSVTASLAKAGIETFGSVAEIVGTSISITVLFTLALLNGISFVSLVHLLHQRLKSSEFSESSENVNIKEDDNLGTFDGNAETYPGDMLEKYMNDAAPKGCLGRILAPIIMTVNASWKMFPIGFLFGIGFDTSTEIGLLALSASQVNNGSPDNSDSAVMPTGYIMFLPILFTAGMGMVDTCDGIFMSYLYSWAYVDNPFRRIMFNLVATLTSVLFGLFVGIIQLIGLLSTQLQLTGPFWKFWNSVSESSEIIGGSMIVLFLVAWVSSYAIYRRLK